MVKKRRNARVPKNCDLRIHEVTGFLRTLENQDAYHENRERKIEK